MDLGPLPEAEDGLTEEVPIVPDSLVVLALDPPPASSGYPRPTRSPPAAIKEN